MFLQTKHYMLFILPVFVQNDFSMIFGAIVNLFIKPLRGLGVPFITTYKVYWIISLGHFVILKFNY